MGGSYLRGLQAEWALFCDGAKITGNVILNNGFRAEGKVSLLRTTVGGDLDCSGGTLIGSAIYSGGILIGRAGDALSCDGAKITGNVFLNNGFEAEGEVRLAGATIGGGLDCSEGQVIKRGGTALFCDGAKITGTVSLNHAFKAEGQVRLVGATIEGDFSCDGGQLLNQGGYALSADRANIKGGASFSRFNAEGHVSLVGATIGGDLNCSDAILRTQTGGALSCDGANIAGNVFLNNGFTAEGEVGLLGVTIGQNVYCDRGILVGRGGPALSCDRATIAGNIFLRYDFQTDGEVILVGATIGANLDCDGAILSNPTGNALSCDGAKITGNVFLNNGFRAEGKVSLLRTTVGGDLDCSGGTLIGSAIYSGGILIGRAGDALSCDGAKITGNVFLHNGCRAEGEVRLVGATIGEDVNCDGGILNGFKVEGKVEFTAASVARYFYWKNVTSPELTVLDLRSAKVGVLADDEKSWRVKERVFLDGFTYDRIDNMSPTDADSRVKWLERQSGSNFLPQPYEQLAAVLRNMGHEEQAVKVMIAKNRDHAHHTHFLSEEWWWYNVFGQVIAYGYRPSYAFGCGLLVILLGWYLFWCGKRQNIVIEAKKEDHKCPQFNSFVYSLETFVPLLKLEMGEYWTIDTKPETKPEAETETILSKLLCLPAWLLFFLYALPSCLLFLVRSVACLLPKLCNRPQSSPKFCPPTPGSALRCYFWLHIIAGWVITTLWVAALTGLVKS